MESVVYLLLGLTLVVLFLVVLLVKRLCRGGKKEQLELATHESVNSSVQEGGGKAIIQGAFYIPAKKDKHLALSRNISHIQGPEQTTLAAQSQLYRIQPKGDDTILDLFSNLDKEEQPSFAE